MATYSDSRVYDTVVIGGGVIGSAAACAAALPALRAHLCSREAGRVALVESLDLGHSLGSSHGQSRIIRRVYPSETYAGMMKHSYDTWGKIALASGLVTDKSDLNPERLLIHTTGGLDLAPKHSPIAKAILTACEAQGVTVRKLTAAEAMDEFGVEVPSDYLVTHQEESGVLNAGRACEAIRSAATANGVEFLERWRLVNAGVFGADGSVHPLVPRSEDTGVAATACRACIGEEGMIHLVLHCQRTHGARRPNLELVCSRLVVCPGPWVSSTCKDVLGCEPPPIRVSKVVVHYVQGATMQPDAASSAARAGSSKRSVEQLPVVIDYSDWQPTDSPAVTAAAVAVKDEAPLPPIYVLPSREFPGMIKVASHIGYELAGPGEPFAPETRSFEVPRSDFVTKVQPWLVQRLASVVDTSAPVHSETCLYSSTPDEDFVIDDVSGIVGGGRFGDPHSGEAAGIDGCPRLPRGSIVLCAGFSGHGFKLAPTVGAVAAAIALCGEEGLGEEAIAWLGGRSSGAVPGRTGAAGSMFSISRF